MRKSTYASGDDNNHCKESMDALDNKNDMAYFNQWSPFLCSFAQWINEHGKLV